jgi:hypothetical protein
MFHHLTLAVRDRVIRELRDFWSNHPRYPDFAKNIQGKYSFDERPQFGMIVRTGGASNVVLSPDNFIGTVEGYVSLAKFPGKPFLGSVEWVREDPYAQPLAGVYHLKVFEGQGSDPNIKEYDVYHTRYRKMSESNLNFISTTEIILGGEAMAGSVSIHELPSRRKLASSEYQVEGNKVTLTEPLPRGLSLIISYTEDLGQQGPFRVKPARAYRDIIEGVTIVFGRRLQEGDEMAILVAEQREEVSQEYGGRWDVSVEMDLIARDVHSQADIADQTVVWIWSTLRPKLANMGLELSDVSLGGEAEEVYDDNGDDYFYTASISFSLQVDWFIHFPLFQQVNNISLAGIQLSPIEAPVTGIGNDTEFIQRLL